MARTWLGLATFCASVLVAMPAQAQGNSYYVCEGADGSRHITDNEAEARKYKNCQKRGFEIPTIIPAPKAPAARPGNGGSTATPANFPRVDAAQQKSRDEGRRDILEEELSKQETKCAALKKEFNNGEPERQGNERNFVKYQERVAKMKEDVARCDADIVALKKEIALIK
jgi:hypothetical protein